jgi:membrane-associated phospholipid phosphatase
VLVWLLLLAVLLIVLLHGARDRRPRGRRFLGDTGRHYRRHYYSRRNFLRLGGAIAGAAALAYSGLDERLEEWHAREVRSRRTDSLAAFLHFFGNRPWFLYWGLFALADAYWYRNSLTLWGRKSFDAMVVGLPSLWVVQRGLGAARPSDGTHGPRFRPLADDNTASGHTFIAAVPCLVAARMLRQRPPQTLAYALSPLTGWSRINDRRHYPSQVALGYGLAWTAVETVMEAPSDRALPAPPATTAADDDALER